MTIAINIENEDGLNIIHIDDYKSFNSTIAEIRRQIKTRILLYFVVKTDPPTDGWIIGHQLGKWIEIQIYHLAHDVIMDRLKRESDLTVVIVSTQPMGQEEWDFYEYNCPMIKLDYLPSVFELLPDSSDAAPLFNHVPDCDAEIVDGFFSAKEMNAMLGSVKEREELGYRTDICSVCTLKK